MPCDHLRQGSHTGSPSYYAQEKPDLDEQPDRAPAGIDRGRVFNAVSVSYKTSRGERDVLYPEGINVIANRVGFFANGRKAVGEKFTICDMDQLGNWMTLENEQLEAERQKKIKLVKARR